MGNESWFAVRMRESEADIEQLQALLDTSYRGAGSHLLSIHTPERRLDARGLVGHLEGMCLLALATVTTDGRPIVGPVDGIFYRGSFYFGSSDDSLRFRHIHSRPQVSAVHLPGEELAVTVHGRAVLIDLVEADHSGFRQTLLDVYVPRYGESWEQFLETGVSYARIDADRMFAYAAHVA